MPIKPKILTTALSEKELMKIGTEYSDEKFWAKRLVEKYPDFCANLYYLYHYSGVSEKKIKKIIIDTLGEKVIPGKSRVRPLFEWHAETLVKRLKERGIIKGEKR